MESPGSMPSDDDHYYLNDEHQFQQEEDHYYNHDASVEYQEEEYDPNYQDPSDDSHWMDGATF